MPLPAPHSVCDFFLFRHMKGEMKGKHFVDVSEVKRKTLEVLNNYSTEEFQKCFQQWEKRWYKCTESKGQYFEGDWSFNGIKPNKPFKKIIPVIFGSLLIEMTSNREAKESVYLYNIQHIPKICCLDCIVKARQCHGKCTVQSQRLGLVGTDKPVVNVRICCQCKTHV